MSARNDDPPSGTSRIPDWAWLAAIIEIAAITFVAALPRPPARVETPGPLRAPTLHVTVATSTPSAPVAIAPPSPPSMPDTAPVGESVASTSEVGDVAIGRAGLPELPRPYDAWPHPHPDVPFSSFGSVFGGRQGTKLDLATRGGGGASTENAVRLGLEWLVAHQDADGKWDGDGFMKHDPAGAECSGAATLSWADPGLTGLATLALLGNGHTHRYGVSSSRCSRSMSCAASALMPPLSPDEPHAQLLRLFGVWIRDGLIWVPTGIWLARRGALDSHPAMRRGLLVCALAWGDVCVLNVYSVGMVYGLFGS